MLSLAWAKKWLKNGASLPTEITMKLMLLMWPTTTNKKSENDGEKYGLASMQEQVIV